LIANVLYSFENVILDTQRRELRRGGAPIAVQPQVFDLLEYLIRNRERVVSKEDLIADIWGGRIVSESALTSRINAARIALGDNGDMQRLIRTVQRKGLRFIGPVVEHEDADGAPPLTEAAPLKSPPSPPERPSIAVLPFQNMSGDPEQEYFADGMVDEIITGLSRIKWLSVISRNSTFIYKNKPVAIREVADKFGVGYVLEGGVRKSGNRIRISAQLIDAKTDAHLWAEQYDRVLEDVFALQDEITMHAISAIEPSLRKAEIDRVKRQRPNNLSAYDLVLRSLPLVFAMVPKDAEIAIPLLETAVKLQPDYGAAYAFLGWCYHHRFVRGGLREEDRIAAVQHARAAVAYGSDDATALAVAAHAITYLEHDTATALKLFDRALELSNSNIFALSLSSIALAWMGKAEPAIERAERAIRLSPFDSYNFRSHYALAITSFSRGRYQDAVDSAQNAVHYNPHFGFARGVLAAALLRIGRVAEAKAAGRDLLEREPTFTTHAFSAVELDPAVFRPFAEAWRELGWPY
jgi:TolB-like protein